MKRFIFSFVVLASLSSFAYVEADWSSSAQLDTSKRTYIVVAGEGFDNMGSQFTKSALSQVKKIREYEPLAQVVLYVVTSKEHMTTAETLQAWAPDATVVPENNDLMIGSKLLQVLSSYSSISGLFIFSHSTPTMGLALQGSYERFGSELPKAAALKSHFTADAIIGFYGCNTGYASAPRFATMWKVPALGALTSTNFQELHSNGNFYANDPGLYPRGRWASSNARSFAQSWSCPEGECLRMKPDNVPYSGIWGTFGAGLGFYKMFCALPFGDRCLQAMKTAALLWVGPADMGTTPSRAQVMDFIHDYFCPMDSTSEAHRTCARGIDNALATSNKNYSAFSGSALNCPFWMCDYTVQSTVKPKLTFVISPLVNAAPSTTMMDEVHAYLKAFNLE